MESHKERILELVPAIRMIMSYNGLKSGSFVPIDQLNETDPEKISVRLGCSLSVFKGDAESLLEAIKKS